MKNNEKILYQYDVGTGALTTQIVAGVICFILGTIGWILPIVDGDYWIWSFMTFLGYPIAIWCFYMSFGFCRKYIVSDRSVSISKGFFTDLEFPADSIIGIKRISFFSLVTIATAVGKFTVFGLKDSKECFDALKAVLYGRQDAPEFFAEANKAPKFDDELPDL